MSTLWTNLLAWWMQAAMVAAAGAALPYLFRLKAARARLWYWHVLLAVCLILPLLQPPVLKIWSSSPASRSDVTFTTGPAHVADVAREGPAIPWTEIGLMVMGLGIGLRLLWLSMGLLRLRRYHEAAIALESSGDDFGDLRRAIAPQTEILVSEQVTSPVTFGVWNAVVLLPVRFRGLGLAERRSIVCHELMHVERRDWAVAIVEEVIRSILWFHPAVWWLLGRIQLTREQVVDEAVIAHTGDRSRYLDALLAIASLRLRADLAPAPLFLKKRHLRQRVESIVSGVNMTKRNLLFPLAAAFATLPIVIGIAAWQFPLRAGTPEATDDPGITLQLGGARILHRTGIAFPDQARATHLSGTVVAGVTVDDKGEVTEAHVVSGPEVFRKAVVPSIYNWHFSMDANAARSFEFAVRFDGGQAPPARGSEPRVIPPNAPDVPRTVLSVSVDGLSQALQERVNAAGLVRNGDVVTRDTFSTIESGLRNIDDHLRLRGRLMDGDKVTLAVVLDTGGPANGLQPIRVGGNAQSNNLIKKVTPLYPVEAKKARIQGLVRFNAVIGADGAVKSLEVESGHPLLVQAAMEAVKQWVYRPTLLNGNPVDVMTVIDVNFTLSQ